MTRFMKERGSLWLICRWIRERKESLVEENKGKGITCVGQ